MDRSTKTTRSPWYLMPVATGYVRLARLEWAKEVAKAARGVTSVATIEPPAHAPTCATLYRPGHQRALVDHHPFQIIGHGRRHEPKPKVAAH
jgi:hypothetical protein